MEGGTNQGYITGLYEEVLNRSASNAEIAYWETAIDNGAFRFDVSLAFLTSQEYRTDLVQADYMTFLLRPADSGGLNAFVDALNAGQQTRKCSLLFSVRPRGTSSGPDSTGPNNEGDVMAIQREMGEDGMWRLCNLLQFRPISTKPSNQP